MECEAGILERNADRFDKLSIGSGNVQSQQSAAIQWLAPVAGRLKLNVDASVYAGISIFAVGMVLRDYLERFIKVRNLCDDREVKSLKQKPGELWKL